MERLRLPLPGFPPGRLGIHFPGATEVHIARLDVLVPEGHPAGLGLAALPALFDLLHLPHGQIPPAKPGT
jgi:hypothetical protein